MPQCMSGNALTFQRAMDILLANLQYESVIVYLDDLIVFEKDYDQHLSRLEEVLKRLKDTNLRLSLKKCHFLKSQVQYFGHTITQSEIKPDPSKVRAITAYPTSTNVKTIRSFLGLAAFYRRFIKKFH